MKIINRTGWDTADVNALIRAAVRARLRASIDRPGMKRHILSKLEVTVAYRRRKSRTNGWALIGHPRMWIFLPRVEHAKVLWGKPIARTVWHEVDHVRGLQHRDMVYPADRFLAWAATYWITQAEDQRQVRHAARAAEREERS
jgi:hypothetical protein